MAIDGTYLVLVGFGYGLLFALLASPFWPTRLEATSPALVAVACGVIYGLVMPGLGMFADGPLPHSRIRFADHQSSAMLNSLIAVAVFSITARLASSSRGHVEDRWDRSTARHIELVVLGLVLVVTVTAVLYGFGARALVTLGTPREAAPIGYLSLLPNTLFVLSQLQALRYRRTPARARLYWCCSLIPLMFSVLSGTRGSAMTMIVALAVLHFTKDRRVTPGLRPVALLLLPAAVTLGALGSIRSAQVYGSDRGTLESLTASFDIHTPLAGVHSYVEAEGLLLGQSYLSLLSQPIPRVAWPSKPSSGIVGVTDWINPGAGVAFPLWGEAYLNFGWIGVVMLMLGLGLMAGRAQAILLRSIAESDTAVVVLAALPGLIFNSLSRGYLTQNVYLIASFILPVVLFADMGRPLRTRRPKPMGFARSGAW